MIAAPQLSLAEEFAGGNAAELATEAKLLRGPQGDSQAIGRLPKGTILTLMGESKGRWVKVEVELVDGVEQGWIEQKAIKVSSVEDVEESGPSGAKILKRIKKKKRLPDDEIAVLKREAAFNYGIYGGVNYGILASAYEAPLYQGLGVQGGGFFGYFLSPEMTLGAEFGFTQLSGSQAQTGNSNSVKSGTARLLDIAGVFEYFYRSFRFFGAVQYSLGIALADFPVNQPPNASDVSGLWIKAGVGYSLALTDVANLVAKAFYGVSFNRTNIGFQNFGVSAYLEFKG